MNNPYSSPSATVNISSKEKEVNILPRFSAWGVFGLTVITLGIYYFYWLYTRTSKLNEVVDEKIPMWLVYTSMATYILYMGLNMVPEGATNSLSVTFMVIGVMLIYVVFYYWWLYAVRSRIQSLSSHAEFKIGPVLTFFFQPIYLQYKVNQYHDQHGA